MYNNPYYQMPMMQRQEIIHVNGENGATTSETVAVGDSYNIALTALVRNIDCEPALLTVVLGGVAADIDNISVVVEKV